MNTKAMWQWVVMGLLMMLVCFGSGCAAVASWVGAGYDQAVTEMPGTFTTNQIGVKTNFMVLPAQTNAVTGAVTAPVITKILEPQFEVVQGPPTYVTNYTTKAGVNGVISAGGLLPVPGAGLASAGVLALYSLGATLLNLGQKRDLTNSQKVLKGVIASVQEGREFLATDPEGQKVAAKFKDTIVQAQLLHGVAPQVKSLLDQWIPDHKTS